MKKTILILSLIIALPSLTLAKTKISWWQFWTDPGIKPVIEQIVTDFETANPDIEVELTDMTWSYGHQKIAIAFASDRGPDVVELGSDWIAEFAANDHLLDISETIAADSSQYQGWGMANYNNKIYAAPWFLGTRVLFANRDLLNQAGFDSKFLPLNLDQLKKASYRIDSLDKKIYGFGSNSPEKHRLYKKYLPFFWSFGGKLFDDENNFCLLASNFGVKSLQYYKELHDSTGYVANQRGIEDAFLDGKIGFIISGDWLLKRIEKENRKFNLVSTLMPGQKFNGKSFLGGEFLAVNSASKNKEAAIKFVKFVTSAKNQIQFCKNNRSANPSSIEAASDEYFTSNPHLMTFIKQIQFATHPPVNPNWVNMEELIEDAVTDALFNDKLPGESLLKARKEIEKLK